MKYKLVVYGNDMYKETIISDEVSGTLSIGTDKSCQIAFRQDRFLSDFRLNVDCKEDGSFWVDCSGEVYLKSSIGIKEYISPLKIGDHICVCYDKTNQEFFFIDFFVCYERKGNDYDMEIDCSQCLEVTIGGQVECTIRVDDANLSDDIVYVRKLFDGYEISFAENMYGIEINGFMSRERNAQVKEGEFFSIKGYSFCIKNGFIYTTKNAQIITNQRTRILKYQNNHFTYPKFIKNVRQEFVNSDESIEVLNPKDMESQEEQSFLLTVMPMLVNMLLMVVLRGVMGGGGMFVIYFAATMTVSTTVTVVNYISGKKKKKEKEEHRRKVYMEYLTSREDVIIKAREDERTISNYMNPSLDSYLKFVDDFDARLFEKKREHEDYLTVRLGEGVIPSRRQVDYKHEEYVDTEDDLKDYPKVIHDKYEYLDGMPVNLKLKDVNAVGFIGNRTRLYQMEKNLILEFSASHFYKDVKLFLIMENEDVKLFDWARWLKNTYNDQTKMRNYMYDEESAKITLEYLYSELSRRENEKNISEEDVEYIVLVYRSNAISKHPVSKYIMNASKLGFHFLFFEECEEFLHEACTQRIFLENSDYRGYIQDSKNGTDIQTFTYGHVTKERAGAFAKKLAGVFVDEVSLENTLTKNISLFELLGILNPYDLDLNLRWNRSKIYDSMAAPIGVKSGNEMVCLDLHEKYHGPHGLVAGTTGSGKSEILQTYILSMATLFHPYEVGFIIIDFKGGGMVNQFRDLPHLNGAITNIDGNEIERSLLSIKAELMKRQELFAKQDVNHIDDYIRAYKNGDATVPLPHLILIVDEFAELKSEQPEFMKELISAARIGRSLGVHLILATQKPSGVVSEQIWSNSKFKLCLKVQNKNDSNEVLKSPLAAEIREPGRAYLQVGNNEVFQLFQSAYSGATAETDAISNQRKFVISNVELSGKRQVIYEQKPSSTDGGETQLKALVNYINEYCQKQSIERLSNICLPALEDKIPFTYDGFDYNGADIVIPVGVVDDPERQSRYLEVMNFSQNNIFILGSSQSGKTNLLQIIVRGIAERYTPSEVHIYILDFASMILKNFENLNHVADVITSSDEERLKGFIKFIQANIQERKNKFSKMGLTSYSAYRESGKKDYPQIVVLLDNWIAFRSYFPDYGDAILALSRESASVGISLVLTSPQASGIGFKLLSNFSKRTALYCNDSSDYGLLFESCRKKIYDIAGRAIIENSKTFYECQYYLAFAAEKEFEKIKLIRQFIEDMHEKYGDSYIAGIPEIPEHVTEQFICKQFGTSCFGAYDIPLGMEFESIGLCTISLDKEFTYSLIGGVDTRKKAYVSYMIQYLISRQEEYPLDLYIMDDLQGEYKTYENAAYMYETNEDNLKVMLSDVETKLKDRASRVAQGAELAKESLILFVINKTSVLKAIGTNRELQTIYKTINSSYRQYKICFLCTDLDNSPIAFSSGDMLRQIKESRKAIVFEDIRNIKAFDIPLSATREFKKALDRHDAYLFAGDRIEKVRVVEG